MACHDGGVQRSAMIVHETWIYNVVLVYSWSIITRKWYWCLP